MKNTHSTLDDDLASAIAPEYDDDFPAAGHSINQDLFVRSRNGVNGFGIVPLWAIREVTRVKAHYATALMVVILQRMRVRKVDTVPVTDAIWQEIGGLTKCERQTVLEHLRHVPGVLKLEERHKRLTRYQVTLGEMWDHRRACANQGETPEGGKG